jgi:crotonobetainyl-CoA:carnitine CoA-transferase CaiB-like acyl-CoA transferase
MLMAVTTPGRDTRAARTGKGRRRQVAMPDAMIPYMRICLAAQARTGKAAQAA